MKTTTLILVALVLCFFCTISINAVTVLEKQSTEKQLTDTLKSLFQNIPLEDLMVQRERSNIRVNFEINSNNELTNIQIDGSNPELNRYAFNELTHFRTQKIFYNNKMYPEIIVAYFHS
jgi:Na+-transporting NADH:ubiquinone oxidoreductase subunit NqrC